MSTDRKKLLDAMDDACAVHYVSRQNIANILDFAVEENREVTAVEAQRIDHLKDDMIGAVEAYDAATAEAFPGEDCGSPLSYCTAENDNYETQTILHRNRLKHELGIQPRPGGGLHHFTPNDPMKTKEQGKPRHISGAGDRSFAAMFGRRAANDSHGWSDPDEFLRTVHGNMHDPRQIMAATMTEGLGSGGGFAVPEEFAAQWMDSALESEIVRPRAQLWPMRSVTLRIPGFDASDNSSTLLGGFNHEWIGEATTATDSSPELRQVVLNAHKLALFSRASNELISDGISIHDQLSNAMISATAFALDDAFLSGTGAGEPMGVLNASSLITCDKEVGQAAASLTYTNLTTMLSRLAPGCVSNSVWCAHQSCIPSLAALTIPVGTGGSFIPAMTESNGEFRLLTRPVIFTEKLKTLGTVGDVILADFSQFAIGLRQEMTIQTSQHIGWQNDTVGYRCLIRVDGAPLWSGPRTPKNGATVSWAVALETRS